MSNVTPIRITLEQRWIENKGPTFFISIDEEGNVEYIGVDKVRTTGRQISKITVDDVMSIINEAEIIYFFSLRNNYGDLMSFLDSPQISILIIYNNNCKRISFVKNKQVQYPSSLLTLETKIKNTIGFTD